MKKHKLIIASVLKPVDSTRMYEKFALSLGQTNKYDINIIGFCVKNIPEADNIRFHPVFKFKRLAGLRLTAPWVCFKKYLQLKPKLIIINTHELLIVTILYKIIFGTKVIYDVQENYFRNLLYTNSFPVLLRPLLAGYVRGKEYISRLFIDHYFLAEKNYENEFKFTKGKSTILENKYKPVQLEKPLPVTLSSPHHIRLIFTGTLAESTGVFEAIEIAEKLHESNTSIHLSIIGFCAMESTYLRLLRAIENRNFIDLKGGNKLVSHQEIIRAINDADFGIIYYPWNRSTMNTMPTKLYEYLANGLPVLIQNHQPWVDFCNHYNAAIPVVVNQLNASKILAQMKAAKKSDIAPEDELFWHSEEQKLLNIINKITHLNY